MKLLNRITELENKTFPSILHRTMFGTIYYFVNFLWGAALENKLAENWSGGHT